VAFVFIVHVSAEDFCLTLQQIQGLSKRIAQFVMLLTVEGKPDMMVLVLTM
jgi:hypothetical protein